jgi:hypothetical protein
MWVRSRETAFAFAFFLLILAFQPLASSEVWTKIPLANYKNGNAGIVSIELNEGHVTVDVKSHDSDVIHIPILAEGSAANAKGVLWKDSLAKEVRMPLVNGKFHGKLHCILILDQDWPQHWDELVIPLDDQDWPQYKEVIIPLEFQDWPQSWLKAELA